jgi:hypothetical protein
VFQQVVLFSELRSHPPELERGLHAHDELSGANVYFWPGPEVIEL